MNRSLLVVIAMLVAASFQFAAVSFVGPVSAQERKEKLAVLNLKATTGGFTPTYLEFLTDKMRQTVRDRLGDKYEFMSKEAILQIELGMECPASEEAGCDLEVGQQLMTDLLVTGTVFKEGSVIRYTLKLMRVHQGVVLKILTGEPVYNAKALEKKIAGAAEELISALTKGLVEISSIPTEAQVEVDRSGKATGVTPCELMLNPGKHVITVSKEGFYPTDIEVVLSPGTKKTLPMELKPRKVAPDVVDQSRPSLATTCDKVGFSPSRVQSTLANGGCRELSDLVIASGQCRRQLKRSVMKTQEVCARTRNPDDCRAQDQTRTHYNEEVDLYRSVVTKMRQKKCPGTPN